MAKTFTLKMRGHDIEWTADDYEYSPEIGIFGCCFTLYAVYEETGEEFTPTPAEEELAQTRACEMYEDD